MLEPLRRRRSACAPALLIVLAAACHDGPLGPGDTGPGVDPAPRMIFTTCLVWALDNLFRDVCAKGGFRTVDVNGDERMVFAPDGFYPEDPAWSPDGTKVAFAGYPICISSPEPCPPDLYTMNADGSSVLRLTTAATHGSSLPAWTPDGQRIAYVASVMDGFAVVSMSLRVMNADGSGDASLGDLSGINPAWSPDGTRIAYAAWDTGRGVGIHVADADGSNPIPLTTVSEEQDLRPTWSPDGQRIAFTRSHEQPGGFGTCQVFVMDADGSDLVQITNDPYCAHNPAWSPDGSTIAFNGLESPNRYGITLMNPDGTSRRLIRPGDSWPSRVSWLPIL